MKYTKEDLIGLKIRHASYNKEDIYGHYTILNDLKIQYIDRSNNKVTKTNIYAISDINSFIYLKIWIIKSNEYTNYEIY